MTKTDPNEAPLDGTTGDALRATATLKEIQIVDVRRVSVQLKPNFGRRAARSIFGGRQWLCPIGTPVSTSEAENRRHNCREVITKTFGDQSYLAFADDGAALGADATVTMVLSATDANTLLAVDDELWLVLVEEGTATLPLGAGWFEGLYT